MRISENLNKFAIILQFLSAVEKEARDELKEIKSDGDANSYAAGYQKGRLELVKEIKNLLK